VGAEKFYESLQCITPNQNRGRAKWSVPTNEVEKVIDGDSLKKDKISLINNEVMSLLILWYPDGSVNILSGNIINQSETDILG